MGAKRKNNVRSLILDACREVCKEMIKRKALDPKHANLFGELANKAIDKSPDDLLSVDIGAIIRVVRSGKPSATEGNGSAVPPRVFLPSSPTFFDPADPEEEEDDGGNGGFQQQRNWW